MSMSTMTSLMFTQMKHPMAMGLMLLIQTTMVCIISGTMYSSFWFSYILFMIMIGGMLVLFMYMTSLASNEMFSPSNKMLMLLTLLPIMMYIMPTVINNKEMNEHNTMMENEITTTTTVMYNQMMGTMTTLLVLYMLLTLIVVVNIINVSKGPLRHAT
uniref:NADH-ubiquinone oxidoreductase chain 6 n=1 Tax=Neocapritermes angusticeps TaxID=187547 RepID=A0A1S5VMW7_9NEOP|nr:NADH dehydrogenase subunit 6 [Neocapritermes angusticeps]AQP27332.1 NADH dehydrogenase subunit 6 [Neocapritermes angusticeps]